jgi:hypothetical protein
VALIWVAVKSTEDWWCPTHAACTKNKQLQKIDTGLLETDGVLESVSSWRSHHRNHGLFSKPRPRMFDFISKF